MGCNCGGRKASSSRQVSTTSGGVPYVASDVAYRHWSGDKPGDGGRSDYDTVEQLGMALASYQGSFEKVDPFSGRVLDCPECESLPKPQAGPEPEPAQ